jgi:urocanate hydratase
MLSPTDVQLQTLRLYAELISRHPTLASRLVFAQGPACSATGLPAAVSIAGGTSLLLDPDTPTVKSVFRQGGLDFVVNSLDEAVRVLKNEVRKHTPLSVALTADSTAVLAEMRERGITPDLEVTLGADATTVTLAHTHLHLDVAEGSEAIVQPSRLARNWLASNQWSEHLLPAATTAGLRTLDTRLVATLDNQHRQQWLRRIPHYQRPAPNTGRAIWLTPREHADFLTHPIQ